MKKPLLIALLLGVLAGAFISPIPSSAHTGVPTFVTWSTGQTLTSTDLNNALAHIHNTLTGGIDNTHISTVAGIAHSKLATPALVPKAWVTVRSCASSTTCTLDGSSRITSVAHTATVGTFTVTLSYTPTAAAGFIFTPILSGGVTPFPLCFVKTISGSAITVACERSDATTAGLSPMGLTFISMDN